MGVMSIQPAEGPCVRCNTEKGVVCVVVMVGNVRRKGVVKVGSGCVFQPYPIGACRDCLGGMVRPPLEGWGKDGKAKV